MLVRFLCSCEMVTYDEKENEDYRLFHEGDEVELDITGHPQRFVDERFQDDPTHVNVQFANGDRASCLSRDWFATIGE